jgi:hypothetical protein
MKLTVGKKAVIARSISSILWASLPASIIYTYILYIRLLIEKYDVDLSYIFEGFDINGLEFLAVIIGTITTVIFVVILLSHIYNLVIGIHYFKKSETIISSSKIVQSTYGFPYSKDLETILISDILKVEINQSSIERMLGCGDIYIKGYSNSNFSKTKFKLYIEGLDSVLAVRDSIMNEFKNNI